jgi:type IV fimbrial biogenesis protein FimT
MNATQKGFTLWELMMTLVVAGIVLGLGVPSFMEFQRNNSMAAAANELVSGAMLARTESVKRQVPVTLCASPDPTSPAPVCDTAGANGGFVVFVDENANGVLTDASDGNGSLDTGEAILLQRPAPGGTIDVFADSGYIVYAPNGVPRQPAAQPDPPATRILYCDDRGNRTAAAGLSAARVVWIEATGRALVRQGIADVTAATALIEGAVCAGP